MDERERIEVFCQDCRIELFLDARFSDDVLLRQENKLLLASFEKLLLAQSERPGTDGKVDILLAAISTTKP